MTRTNVNISPSHEISSSRDRKLSRLHNNAVVSQVNREDLPPSIVPTEKKTVGPRALAREEERRSKVIAVPNYVGRVSFNQKPPSSLNQKSREAASLRDESAGFRSEEEGRQTDRQREVKKDRENREKNPKHARAAHQLSDPSGQGKVEILSVARRVERRTTTVVAHQLSARVRILWRFRAFRVSAHETTCPSFRREIERSARLRAG